MTAEPEPRPAGASAPSVRRSDRLRRQLLVERVFFLAVIALLAFVIVRQGGALTAYQITVDGRPVAMVSRRATADKLLQDLRGDVPQARFRQTPQVLAVNPRAPTVMTEEQARAALAHAIRVVVPAYVILVNGRLVAAVDSREKAKNALARLRDSYASPRQEAYFKESCRIEQAEVARQKLLCVDDAFKALAGGTTDRDRETYVVKEGDTAWDIASANGLSMEQLAGFNPELDLNRLQKGQMLIVRSGKPLLTVVTVEERTELEMIPHSAQVQVAPELPKGQRRVTAAGQDGQKTVRYRITRENGREVRREVAAETLMRTPRAEVVLVGTKAT